MFNLGPSILASTLEDDSGKHSIHKWESMNEADSRDDELAGSDGDLALIENASFHRPLEAKGSCSELADARQCTAAESQLPEEERSLLHHVSDASQKQGPLVAQTWGGRAQPPIELPEITMASVGISPATENEILMQHSVLQPVEHTEPPATVDEHEAAVFVAEQRGARSAQHSIWRRQADKKAVSYLCLPWVGFFCMGNPIAAITQAQRAGRRKVIHAFSDGIGFGTKFPPILEPKSDQKRCKNRSEN